MAEGRDLVKEAIRDAKSLKEAAVESAKQQLVESLAPAVKDLLNKSIKGVLAEKHGWDGLGVGSGDKAAESRNPADPAGEAKKENEGIAQTLTLEDALQEFFPATGGGAKLGDNKNMAETKESARSSKKSSGGLKEAASSGKSSRLKESAAASSGKSSAMHEEYEISEAELKKVYEAALQTEVQVKKGFSDIKEPFVELQGKTPGPAKSAPPPPTGKGPDKHWEEEEPPAKKDWIPENVRRMLRAGLAENKALRESLRKTVAMVETLGRKLHEVNLFNAKVLHVNKILNSGTKLTKEQKNYVMESIDKARSIGEVKMVFETIVGAMKTTQAALTEGRMVRSPKADAGRARTSGTPDPKVLSESVDRAQSDDKFSRVRQLAGIVNGKK